MKATYGEHGTQALIDREGTGCCFEERRMGVGGGMGSARNCGVHLRCACKYESCLRGIRYLKLVSP